MKARNVFFFLSFLYGQIIFLEWDIYRDNHIARVSSLEVAESVLHLINCCLLNFQVLSFFSSNHHFQKKKKTLRDHNYSNTTYIKDYICGCNRLIERLWVSKWSWIFHSFLSLRTTNKVCISTNSCVICYCLYIILLCVRTCLQVWSMEKESEIFVQFNPHFLLPDSLNFCMQLILYRSLSRCRVK